MDDVQIISPQGSGNGKNSNAKLVLITLSLFLFVGAIGGASYLLGTKTSNEAASTHVEVSPTPQLTEISVQNSPSPTSEPTKKITPTLKASPTPTPTPILKTKILTPNANLDGFRSSNGGGNSGLEIRAGRNANLATRGFVSFDITEIPSGAKIQNATLRLYQVKIIGSPYAVGGSIKVDHLTYGDSLDNSDYASSALSSSFVTLTGNATLEWKDAEVTDKLKDDVANARSTSQYRIHFQTETVGGDVTGDFAYFEAKENTQGTGNTPQLVVKYY
ncbi:MAG: DNRLRE domain-containing protein [Patescibacteria group bacterium]|nr:DNRLRE domain-containing protein [Patescibacteria group bacterium]